MSISIMEMNAFELCLCGVVVSNFRLVDPTQMDKVELGQCVQSTFCYLEIACTLELPARLCENLQTFTTGSVAGDLAVLTMFVDGNVSFADFVRDNNLCPDGSQGK